MKETLFETAKKKGMLACLTGDFTPAVTHCLYERIVMHIEEKLPLYEGSFSKNGEAVLNEINRYIYDNSPEVEDVNTLSFLKNSQVVYLPFAESILLEVKLSNKEEKSLEIKHFLFDESVYYVDVDWLIQFLKSLVELEQRNEGIGETSYFIA